MPETFGSEESGFAPEPELDLGLTPRQEGPRYDGESVPVLRQALWDCYKLAGADTDGFREAPKAGVMTPDVHVLAVEAVRELRAGYDEALNSGLPARVRLDMDAALRAAHGHLDAATFNRLAAFLRLVEP